MVIHFHTGTGSTVVGTGKWVNTMPPIAPPITNAPGWPNGFDISALLTGNHLTNAAPVLEHFSLIYGHSPNANETYTNLPDPKIGFGHGIVAHKRVHIHNCNVSGFPGDGIRLAGTTWGYPFLEGRRIWGLYKVIGPDATVIVNPPDPQHPNNDNAQTAPTNRITVRYSDYNITAVITKNLQTDLGISFIRDDISTVLATDIELFDLEVEILPEGDPAVDSFINIAAGTPATPPTINIEITADTTSSPPIPWGEHPLRVKGKFLEGTNTIDVTSQAFWLYVCDNINNSYPSSVYTNVNTSQIYNTRVSKCKRHGIYTAQIDANACAFVAMTLEKNGGWGVYDNSGLGNTFLGCHSTGNKLGAYYVHIQSDVNRNLFVGCGGEGMVKLKMPTQWIGGSNEQVATYFPDGNIRNSAAVLNKGGIFPLYKQNIQFNNIAGINPSILNGVAGNQGVFFAAGGERNQIFSFGYSGIKDWDMALTNLPVNSSNDHDITYAFVRQGLDDGRPLALTGLFSAHLPPGMPWLHKGFFISKDNIAGSGPRVRVTVGSGEPAEEQVFWEGVPIQVPNPILPDETIPLKKTLGNVGDIHFNSFPNNTVDSKYVAYICTAPFQYNEADPIASTKAVWQPFWLINF